jgi:hypothetical protein
MVLAALLRKGLPNAQAVLVGINAGPHLPRDSRFLVDAAPAPDSTQQTHKGERCFWMEKTDGSRVDVSFTDAIDGLSWFKPTGQNVTTAGGAKQTKKQGGKSQSDRRHRR